MSCTLRAALLAAALCSCHVAPAVGPAPRGVAEVAGSLLSPRVLRLGSTRTPLHLAQSPPLLAATIPFDYASLPLQGASASTGKQRGSSGRARRGEGGYSRHSQEDALVEIERASLRFHPTLRTPLAIRHPRTMPMAAPPCSPKGGVAGMDAMPASWAGIRLSTWKDGSLDHVRYGGPFDRVVCVGEPETVVSTSARALLPRLLYAYRSCTAGCPADEDSHGREETLTVIAPVSAWSSATVSVAEQKRPRAGSFSQLELSVRRGGAASALLTISGADLARFAGRRDGALRTLLESELLRNERLQLTIETVWLEDEPSPTGTIQVAAPATATSAALLRSVLDAGLLEPERNAD